MDFISGDTEILRFVRDVAVEEGGVEGDAFRMAGRSRKDGRRRSARVPRGRLSELGDRKLIVWMHDRGANLPDGLLIGLGEAGAAHLAR